MEKRAIVVLCTCPDRNIAERITEVVVGERLAACVNVLADITSIYHGEGRQQHAREHLLVIKTAEADHAGLQERIHEVHPDQIVEVIALPILKGVADYSVGATP